MSGDAVDTSKELPHSRACGWRRHEHGSACSSNCPTCHGRPFSPPARPGHHPQVMRRKPTKMTCFIWTDESATLPLQRWIAGETGLTVDQVDNEIFHAWTREQGEHGTARLWVNKSQAFCTIKHGDAVVREPDWSGYYPIVASILASTYEPTASSTNPPEPS